ncbi:prephenate dehydrogenase [Lachnoclostridium phytofermentans]|uniref:Prephenate dehydrogenase n=1 Tax=Lachnoclostridium phytofermentans (strain ATCC 700394 / DSM 18823 / ISDg) TaxID=357809 RepID=A9KME6_LACP7|nr:prephenate dehydrogenase [Lachnoclostridium phytofermentans]ABX42900.1 Prephenate dehydrogenase [Lachnoclostridium phytofermentans ISDg]
MKHLCIGFIGLGLIGGSIAKALRANHYPCTIVAYEKEDSVSSENLRIALSDGTINNIGHDLSVDFSNCDIIFLCAPIRVNLSYLPQLKACIKDTCVLTDVGSVKSIMHTAIASFGLDKQFIGGHPMTGSEKSGYLNSSELLLENAYYILTPSDKVEKKQVTMFTNIVKRINAIPIVLDPKDHDNITADISHVPHIIAAELVNLVKESDDPSEKRKLLAAGGFKDITRIASSSPIMWQNICLTNKDSIIHSLKKFQSNLDQVITALEEQDSEYLYQIFESAGIYRNQIPNSKGIIHRIYELYIDITDEPGAIAIIATLLGSNGVSIKNIGIIHNREFEQGVLRIELYSEEALLKAKKSLQSHNYVLYERT